MNKSELIQRYARAGAVSRLQELNAEIDAINQAFPDLARSPRAKSGQRLRAAAYTDDGQTAGPDARAPKTRSRRPLTAAEKKAIGARMKKYWAARRRAEGK